MAVVEQLHSYGSVPVANTSSGDYLRYVNIDWEYTYGKPGLIKMRMGSGDKCLDAGLSESLFLLAIRYSVPIS